MAPAPLFVAALPVRARRHPARSAAAAAPLRPRAQPRCCASPPPPPPRAADVDHLFARLKHVNKNLRKKASAELAQLATQPIIARLLSLLGDADVAYRRTAVQALAMSGEPALPPIVAELNSTQNATVRASCAKALAGLALYFPELRERFPAPALDALHAALRSADAVTKLATVGCLATLGSDHKLKHGVARGNERALDILLSLCNAQADMAVAATAVGALAQIAQNGGAEQRRTIEAHLHTLTASAAADEASGFNYIQEMARSHLEQLQSASAGTNAQ